MVAAVLAALVFTLQGLLTWVLATCACLLLLPLNLLQAMAALDEKHLMEGATTPLAVKWADPLLQIKKRRAVEDSNAENRMVRVLLKGVCVGGGGVASHSMTGRAMAAGAGDVLSGARQAVGINNTSVILCAALFSPVDCRSRVAHVQLFFAKVLRSANEDEVRGLFSRFGRVIEVNLFRAFQVRWGWLPCCGK